MPSVAVVPGSRLALLLLVARMRALGGKGSGNFGHKGRPGEVGGSSSDSGRNIPLRYRVREKSAKPRAKAVAPKAPDTITVYHNSPDVFEENKPNFSAYFGDDDFLKSFPNEWGEHTYAIDLPTEKLLDLDKGSPDAREFMTIMATLAYPNDPGNPEFIEKLKAGDSEAINDFYEAWTDKSFVTHALELMPKYEAVRFRSEFVVPHQTLAKLQGRKFKALGGQGSGNFGHKGRPGEVGGSTDGDGGGRSPRKKASSNDLPGKTLVIPAIHSSDKLVKVFSNDHVGSSTDFGFYGKGIYFSAPNGPSAYYGDKVTRVELRPEKMASYKRDIVGNVKGVSMYTPRARNASIAKAITDYAQSKGFDGIVVDLDDNAENHEFVIFDAKRIRVLGGHGSGNFGHAGRPGQVGGSSESGLPQERATIVRRFDMQAIPPGAMHRIMVNPQTGTMILSKMHSDPGSNDAMDETHSGVYADAMGDNTEGFHQTEFDHYYRGFITGPEPGFPKGRLELMNPANYEVDPEDITEDDIAQESDAVASIIDQLVRNGGLKRETLIEGLHPVVQESLPFMFPSKKLRRALGGPGSGNFGHAGRPGEVGGSSSDGSGAPSMPAHAKETLDAWIVDSDYAINAAARERRLTPIVKQMDEVIAASPMVKGTVYRGVSLDPEDPNQSYILDNLRKGYSFGEKGFSSVTSNEKIATDFASGGNTGNVEVVFEMSVGGRRGAVVPSGLDETVIERNVTYKIDKVARNGSKVRVTGRIF